MDDFSFFRKPDFNSDSKNKIFNKKINLLRSYPEEDLEKIKEFFIKTREGLIEDGVSEERYWWQKTESSPTLRSLSKKIVSIRGFSSSALNDVYQFCVSEEIFQDRFNVYDTAYLGMVERYGVLCLDFPQWGYHKYLTFIDSLRKSSSNERLEEIRGLVTECFITFSKLENVLDREDISLICKDYIEENINSLGEEVSSLKELISG